MKKLIFALQVILTAALLVACVPMGVHAARSSFTPYTNITSVTFAIVSTGVPSAANLRISAMSGRLSNTSNTQAVMAHAPNAVLNYSMTKARRNIKVGGVSSINIDVDQDTKVYLNGLSNYILVRSGTNETLVIYK